MAELEELEQADLEERLLDVEGPATDNLPSVPVVEPVASTRGKNFKLDCLKTGDGEQLFNCQFHKRLAMPL